MNIKVYWVGLTASILSLFLLAVGCTIPRDGIVLHSDTKEYDLVTCEAYSRYYVDHATLICKVKE
jgi:hypothetical protein